MVGAVSGMNAYYNVYGAYGPHSAAQARGAQDAEGAKQAQGTPALWAARRSASPETPVQPVAPVRAADGEESQPVRLGPTLREGADPAETDMKAQGGLDQVDLGGLMSDLGGTRWVTGPLQGQFALESHGRDVAALIAGLGGRASVAIDGGSLAGVDLTDVIHRNGGLAPGALARRNGRTGFERAAVVLRFTDGIGEITEADLRGAGVAATLRGQISLPDQRLDVVALLAPRLAAEGARLVRIAITGPWDALTARTQHGDNDDPTGQTSAVARMRGILQMPASIGLPPDTRAYAP